MSGLGGVSGRPGEPVIKLSSRQVFKSVKSSALAIRRSLQGWGSRLQVSLFQVSRSPIPHVSKSPDLHAMSPGLQISKSSFKFFKSSALAILRSLQGLGSRLQVSMLSKSLRLQVPEFPRQVPGLQKSRSSCLHVPGLQVSMSPGMQVPGLQVCIGDRSMVSSIGAILEAVPAMIYRP